MEDLKQIQEFFSKPLDEGKQLDQVDFAKVVKAVEQTGHPVTVLLVPKFNEIEVLTGMNAPDNILFDLSNAVDALGYGRDDIFIAGDSSNLSRREYSDIRRVNGGAKDYFEESVNEEVDQRNADIYAYQFMQYFNKMRRIVGGNFGDDTRKEFERLVQDKFSNHRISENYNPDLDQDDEEVPMPMDDEGRPLGEMMSLDDQAKAYYLAKVKRGEIDTLPEDPKAAFLAQMMKDQMDHDKETLRRERGLEEADTNKNLKAIQIQLDQLGVKYEMDPKNKVQPFKVIYKPVNKDDDFYDKFDDLVFRYNLKGVVKTSLKETAAYIAETIKLGQQLNEELCEKGKRYIKARQAAGEKSSAYLSGRAVRVCKGQIEWPKKGKKKK